MTLNTSLKQQVTDLFQNLKSKFTFNVTVNNNHPQHAKLLELLHEVSACSDKISISKIDGEDLFFEISKNGNTAPIKFRAIPSSHEFTTLLLAILNLEGLGKNLPDELTIQRIQNIKTKVSLNSYISLSCTNCPEVVQALNIMAIYNPNITHTIVDGAINQTKVEALGIQAVPTVYANDQILHIGRSSLNELLAKLEELTHTTFTPIDTKEKEYDIVIVGGGPAGSAAAIYSARKGLKTAIIAERIGGQVTETVDIENLISVPKTTGTQLASNLKEHLEKYPIDILENRIVNEFQLENGAKILQTSLGETIKASAIIIATGASWRKLNVPGEAEHIGMGVAFCTHCDGPFYKNKKVAVIGGGNSGLEAAIDLASIASEVTVIEFMDTLKGDKVLQNKLEEFNNVKIITHTATTEVIGNGKNITALKYQNRETNIEETLELDGIFVQIGLKANSDVFAHKLETNRIGEILIDAHCRTKIPGIYAAGDVSEVPYKQIVIAMGEGAKAALSAFDDYIKGVI
ncbi:MAG: alkyl hydroperoxide reductase subunit F [Mangrovibacterium sp.]